MASSVELQVYQVFVNEVISINRQLALLEERLENDMIYDQLLETKSYLNRRIAEIRQKI